MITTVPVCAEDASFLFELYCTTRADEISAWGLDLVLAEQLMRMQWQAQTHSYQLQFPAMDHRIIYSDNTKAGRMIVDETDRELHLVDLSLLPALRNQGIGTRLLQQLQREAGQQNKALALSVYLSNPARRLYERLGFSVVSEDGLYVKMKWFG
ncbi:GNAT family N-acetyltransferase [Brevibacillus sp. GCM10020057]|uniref:GNAT family N-acetyltransferase n=1 Tax=Brevibacillus sp. GCM10020057 TaxID=3317327 RepID=UPI0036254A0B